MTDRTTASKIIWHALKRAQGRMLSFTCRWRETGSDTDRDRQKLAGQAWHKDWLEEGNKVRRDLNIRFPKGGPK